MRSKISCGCPCIESRCVFETTSTFKESYLFQPEIYLRRGRHEEDGFLDTSYQQSKDLLLRKMPFARLVKEVQLHFKNREYRWQSSALMAMQEAVEAHLMGFFQDANLGAIHGGKRATVKVTESLFSRGRAGLAPKPLVFTQPPCVL